MQFVSTVSGVSSRCATSSVAEADNPLVVEIWPGNVPDETDTIGAETRRMSPVLSSKEVEVTEPTQLITNVTRPTISI